LNKPIPFGKYYLLERIDVGGMAEVFKAKTVGVEGFERIVALKRILPSIAEDEEFITMFIDEAKIAVQLQHANIAQIFDLGKVDDSYFIALEYVNGRDVRRIFDDLRKQGHAMPVPQVCHLIMQLCEGLDYAHNKRDAQGRDLNLVHRDVSPQNVLIGYEGEVKLIDFGIAKAAGKASKTQAGILKGKFGYMSPEQVRGLPVDRRSDIFALGIVLYEMLTGERLFVGESDFSTLEKVRNVEIIPPSSFNSNIPEKLERIVLKALEKNVEDRYQNAIDLHDDLQMFMHSVGQFSSRKDLSAWMKRTFSDGNSQEGEIAEIDDVEEIEEVELLNVSADEQRAASGSAVVDSDGEEFGWDEEEKETQIFDKDPAQIAAGSGEASFLVEGGDKTVAMAPSKELLDEMSGIGEDAVPTPPRPVPQAVAPTGRASGPASLRRTHMGMGGNSADASPLPPPSAFPAFSSPGAGVPRKSGAVPVAGSAEPARSPFDLPKPVFRQTLIGGTQIPTLPNPNPAQGKGPAYPIFPTFQPSQGVAGAGLPAPSFPGALAPPQAPQQYSSPVDMYPPEAISLHAPSRFKYYVAFVLFMVAGGGAAYMFMTRPGNLQVAVKPQDARLAVDGAVITSDPPFHLKKRPGVYRLTVSRPGYVTKDQNVQISAGQSGHMDIDLEPSPDTGFDLTSQPSGGLVWLDGQSLAIDEFGKQATTNFHASRIAPGPHVVEIRGNPQYKTWRQEFLQEPGKTVRLHADLVPVGSATRPTLGTPPAQPQTTPPAQAQTTPPAQAQTTPPAQAQTTPPAQAQTTPPAQPQNVAVANKPREGKVGTRHGGGRGAKSVSSGDEDVFESMKPSPNEKRPSAKMSIDEDIFESQGKTAGAASGETCVATISSKPWAEVSIDGKPTGKITPLVNYSMPCGKHRVTFKNADLMIERNESVTLKAGQPFKKIFSLVENEL
jgi:eukaryotic-like serine/threonine-protein kinase